MQNLLRFLFNSEKRRYLFVIIQNGFTQKIKYFQNYDRKGNVLTNLLRTNKRRQNCCCVRGKLSGQTM